MTCIIGLEENGKAYIGADSAAAGGWEVLSTQIPKLFTVGKFTIGFTSSYRMGQILNYQVEFPDDTEISADHYMITHFVETARLRFRELGYSKIENNQEEGGQFVVGFRSRIYTVYPDFSINRFTEGVTACGCGREYALGVMAALKGQLQPAARIERALEIAAQFSQGVKPPFLVREVGL
jgi:ATP-dependent protease HslVU (ClpYQ) peptidase subunit